MNNIFSTTRRYYKHALIAFIFGVFLFPPTLFAAQTPAIVTGIYSISGDSSVQILGRADTGGETDARVWFEWGTTASFGNRTNTQSISTITNITEYLSNLNSNTKYYYRIVAENSQGISRGNIMPLIISRGNFAVLPTVTTRNTTDITNTSAAMKGYVDPMDSVNTRVWFEWGNSVSLGNTTGAVSKTSKSYFSFIIGGLNRNATYYYRAVAQNSRGTIKGSILSFRTTNFNSQSIPIYPSPSIPFEYNQNNALPIVTTHLPEDITRTSVKLKALALPGGIVSTDGWFEWGQTPSLGNQTIRKSIGSSMSINFSDSLFGLSPNTVYYYRAVIQNQRGTDSGDVFSFKTKGTSIPITYKQTKTTVILKNVTKKESKEISSSTEKQTASSFAVGGKFFPNTLIEWLLLIILIFILIAISNHLYGVHKKRKEKKKEKEENK